MELTTLSPNLLPISELPPRNAMTERPQTSLDSLAIGYPRLSGQMGLIPETQIFRSFRALNARNLLYLQAELNVLEEELQKIEVEDSKDVENGKTLYAVDWEWLNQPEDGQETEQRNLVWKIREILEKYSTASYLLVVFLKY